MVCSLKCLAHHLCLFTYILLGPGVFSIWGNQNSFAPPLCLRTPNSFSKSYVLREVAA